MQPLSTSLLVAVLLTVSSWAMTEEVQQPSERTALQNETYFKHLEYEYGNRGRTYIGMSKAAKYAKGSDREAFFQAYYEMEVINQQILGQMKSDLGVDYEANWFVHSGLNVITYLGWRFVTPQQLIDIIIPYIPKLQEMESLASPEHKPFFAYIVAQEQAQLDACRAAQQESWDSGAKVFRDFLPQAEAMLFAIDSSQPH